MARYAYERLSAQDASFLWAEQANQPMHIGGLGVLESGPLASEAGGIDIEQYRSAVEGVLHWIPRYRQKLARTPLEGWPVWVDDRQFDLGYHIRHIALPRPGTHAQLKEMAARIFARPLDRRHPLWEIWVIEGVECGSQFALLNKIHHCMIDGAAGADLSQILLSPSARPQANEPVPYMPRPVPTEAELLVDSVALGLRRPLGLLQSLGLSERAETEPEGPTLEQRLSSLRELMGFAISPASETPINGELGPHRGLDWITMPLDDVRELRKVLGCTINDVVLATVAGAMRRYLFRRRVDPRTIDFRIAAPVSTRREDHDRGQGNHVSTWIVPLALAVQDPIEQLRAVQAETESRKSSNAELAVETLMSAAEWLPVPLLSRGVALAQGPANMIVTNVPGPQFPLYMVGARLLGMYPLVPLLPGGGLGIALFSYEGKLCWGFNADPELVPDLACFVGDVADAFEELRNAAVSLFIERRTAKEEAPAEVTETPPPRKKGGGRKARKRGAALAPAAAPDLTLVASEEEGASESLG
jgi:WS/DGAT/MGAT family acyltransferase